MTTNETTETTEAHQIVPAATPIQRMSIAEFRALGYVQEINRLLLHPVGLALEVLVEEDGTERLGGVWDYRADPEGLLFGDETIKHPEMKAKALAVFERALRSMPARDALPGVATGIQMIPGFVDDAMALAKDIL